MEQQTETVNMCSCATKRATPRSATFKPFAVSLPSGHSHVKAGEQRARCVNKRRWARRRGPRTVLVRQHGSSLFDEPKAARTQAKRGDNNVGLPACGVFPVNWP